MLGPGWEELSTDAPGAIIFVSTKSQPDRSLLLCLAEMKIGSSMYTRVVLGIDAAWTSTQPSGVAVAAMRSVLTTTS
jgi:hypothetical protein